MSIETDLFATLDADVGLTALVGSRIYPLVAKNDATVPLVIISMVNGGKLATIKGQGDTDQKEMQISCYGSTYAQSKSVAEAVISALDGNGHLSNQHDMYDQQTKTKFVIIEWSFIG